MATDTQEVLQLTGIVDWLVFSELIAIMDEDEDGLALLLFQDFVTQFEETVVEIDANLEGGNLDELLKLGHYIKGLAAALGLIKISHQCERIQNYGNKHNFDHCHIEADGTVKEGDEDADGDDVKDDEVELTDDDYITLVRDATTLAQLAFTELRSALLDYFGEQL